MSSRRSDTDAVSNGDSAVSSGTKSPSEESSSSPIGFSSETGSLLQTTLGRHLRRPRHHCEEDPRLPAPDQREGRAVHPDVARALGIRIHLRPRASTATGARPQRRLTKSTPRHRTSRANARRGGFNFQGSGAPETARRARGIGSIDTYAAPDAIQVSARLTPGLCHFPARGVGTDSALRTRAISATQWPAERSSRIRSMASVLISRGRPNVTPAARLAARAAAVLSPITRRSHSPTEATTFAIRPPTGVHQIRSPLEPCPFEHGVQALEDSLQGSVHRNRLGNHGAEPISRHRAECRQRLAPQHRRASMDDTAVPCSRPR